jgi:Fic family protein
MATAHSITQASKPAIATQQAILITIQQSDEPLTRKQIQTLAGITENQLRKSIRPLVQHGLIKWGERDRTRYYWAASFTLLLVVSPGMLPITKPTVPPQYKTA